MAFISSTPIDHPTKSTPTNISIGFEALNCLFVKRKIRLAALGRQPMKHQFTLNKIILPVFDKINTNNYYKDTISYNHHAISVLS